MTIPSEDIFPYITGYFFSSPVKKQDLPLFIMRYDPLREVIKDIFQALSVGQILIQ